MKIIYFLICLIVLIIFLNYLIQKEPFLNNYNNKEKRIKLMNRCGLPMNYHETSHCFADGTHQTCCMLGPLAREYADKSGNPIGEASERASLKYGKSENNNLKPWCTCFGSEVCSYYANRFNDGTYIKFLNNPNSNTEIQQNVNPNCEGYYRDKFNIKQHRTPGINSKNLINNNCDDSINNIHL